MQPSSSPNSPTLTIEDRYNENPESVDKVLADGNTPLTEEDGGTTEHNINIDVSDKDHRLKIVHPFVDGCCDFMVDGNESFDGFLEKTKEWVIYAIQKMEDFIEWLIEFVSNKVRTARRRLQDLKRNYHVNGIRIKNQKYPLSISKLATQVNVPNNPNFAIKALDEVQKVYSNVMEFQKYLTRMTQALPATVTKEQTLNIAESFVKGYLDKLGGRSAGTNHEAADLPTSGLRINGYVDKSNGLTGLSISKSINPQMKYKLPEEFIPDADTVNKLILKLDVYLLDVEGTHKSQRSFAHNFKTSLRPYLSSASKYEPEAAEAAKKYYRWLINFQNRSINIPLHYYLSVITAALDLCESQVKQSEIATPKKD